MMTVTTPLRLQALLLELEDELQQLGWWEVSAPSTAALQSAQPFCVDTLEFAQWLQWVFVPRMRSILVAGQPLPRQCGIHDMAEVVYREKLQLVADLLRNLKDIDATITAPHVLH